MNKEILAEILDADVEKLEDDMLLEKLDEWDSISKLSLVIYFEENLNKELSSEMVRSLKMVKDIFELAEN